MSGVSIREQIVSALVALLEAEGAPDGLAVHRERTRPIETDALPALLVYCEDDEPTATDRQTFRSPLVERSLHVIVEARARVTSPLSPDQALDPILVWTATQIMQNETMGGLAIGAVEGKTTWISKEADVVLAAAIANYHIRYRTSRLDPTSRT